MRSRVDEQAELLVELTAAGLSLADACVQAGVPLNTVKHWLRLGRKESSGPRAEFADAIDAARAPKLPTGPLSEQELAEVISAAARKGSVQAMRLRWEQLKREKAPAADALGVVDEIAARRGRARL